MPIFLSRNVCFKRSGFMFEIPENSQIDKCPPPKIKICYFLLFPFDSSSKVASIFGKIRAFQGKNLKNKQNIFYIFFEKIYPILIFI